MAKSADVAARDSANNAQNHKVVPHNLFVLAHSTLSSKLSRSYANFKMVSWFSLFDIRWEAFEDSFPLVEGRDSEVDAAEEISQSVAYFDFIRSAENKFEEIQNWMESEATGPGVVLVVRGKKNSTSKWKVDLIHHLKIISNSEGRQALIGISSMSSAGQVVTIPTDELFSALVPASKLKSEKASERLVPRLRSILEGKYGLYDAFEVEEGHPCDPIEVLTQRASGVFVPYPIWYFIWDSYNRLEGKGDLSIAMPQPPIPLLESLIEGLKQDKAEDDSAFFEAWEFSLQKVFEFLLAAANDFVVGVTIGSVSGNIDALQHHADCQAELLAHALGRDKEGGERSPGSVEVEAKEKELKDPRKRTVPDSDDDHTPLPEPKRPFEGDKDPQVTEQMEKGNPAERLAAGLPPKPKGLARPMGEEMDVEELTQGVNKPGDPYLNCLISIGESLKEHAIAKKESIDKKEMKKKVTAKWLPTSLSLFKVLSSPAGWATQGLPELNEFSTQLVDMKIYQATQLVREKSREDGWSGCILKSGLSDFLKRGFLAEDIQFSPSGFSVLFFHPSGHTETDGEEFGMQQIRESFGDGEMPEEMIKAFNKMQIFVPDSSYKAADQIKAAIKFLECICGTQTISTGGYKSGLRVMEQNRRLFDAEAKRDSLFLLNFLYMLDRIFQAFCKEMKTYLNEQNPIIEASKWRGESWMDRMVDNAINPWLTQGLLPSLQPPLVLSGLSIAEGVLDLNRGGSSSNAKVKASTGGGGGGGQNTRGNSQGKKKEDPSPNAPKWHAELQSSDYIQEWRIPTGKRVAEFFGPHKKENTAGVPKAPHHRTGKPVQICLRYQIENGPRCRNGASCQLAHIRPQDMRADTKEAMSKHMREVYRKEGA